MHTALQSCDNPTDRYRQANEGSVQHRGQIASAAGWCTLTYLREDQHAERKDDSRNHLKTPWDTERGRSVEVGAPEFDKVLQEDAPGD